MALNYAPFGRRTLRQKAAQRRLAQRYTLQKMTRVLWATIGLLPLTMCAALFFTEWRLLGGQYTKVGYVIFVLGAVISVGNMYTSFLRYPVHLLLAKSRDSYKYVSGLPLIGGLVLVGAWLLPQSLWLNLATALLMLLDTGGISWFVVTVLSDSSFWGKENV